MCMCVCGGGGGRQLIDFPTFDVESKSAQNPSSLCPLGVGVEGWVGQLSNLMQGSNLQKTQKFLMSSVCVCVCVGSTSQLLMPSPNLPKTPEFPMPTGDWGGRGWVGQLSNLMQNPNLQKKKKKKKKIDAGFCRVQICKKPKNSLCQVCVCVWGGEVNFPTFDAESKSAQTQNSLCPLGGGGGVSLHPKFWWGGGRGLDVGGNITHTGTANRRIGDVHGCAYILWRVRPHTFVVMSQPVTQEKLSRWLLCSHCNTLNDFPK